MFIDQVPKLAKGFIRLGHDVRSISYSNVIKQLSPLKSKKLTGILYKKKADDIIAKYAKCYEPDIVILGGFPRHFNGESVERLKNAAPNSIFIGGDGDPWPKLNPERIETAKHFDIMTATNDGQWLQDYKDAGAKNCIFMPNYCDPDIDHRYQVPQEFKTDILWTGNISHHADTSDDLREKLLTKLVKQKDCALYGCFGRPKIGGIDYLYAISGAKIGVSINAVNSVRLYHSDRLTHYLACGTFILAKKVPDTELLFKDGVHVKYFNTVEEFFELSKWYLEHEEERKKIADAGMKWIHEQFNCVKIAGYILELAEKGQYGASWFKHLLINKKNSQ